MDKTISTKLPEEEVEPLEKIAAERGESVSGFVRNLVRMAIEKNGKVDQNPDKNQDPETAKKIDGVAQLLSEIHQILDARTQKILDEIGQIPKSEGGGTGVGIDVSGLKTSVSEISKALVDGETKAKNILGGMAWKISLIFLCIGAGFVAGGYALALYAMPDIPALLKQQMTLKESIRVLEIEDPKKLNMTTCDGEPCVQIVPSQSYHVGQAQNFYRIDPIK